jgi:capsid protein
MLGSFTKKIKAWWPGSAYGESTGFSTERSNVLFYLPADSTQYITSYTRYEILRKAEWLYQNFGICKLAVHGIARHTIGKGISLQCDSTDDDWNRQTEWDFEDYCITPSRFDASSRRDFYDGQQNAIEQYIWRGEFFGAHTTAANGEPQLQLFDSQEIQTPSEYPANVNDSSTVYPSGDQSGAPGSGRPRVVDGIELNDALAVQRFWVRIPGNRFKAIDAGEMIHFYKPERTNDLRGISHFAQAVNKLIDIHDLIKITTKSAKLHQALAVIAKQSAQIGQPGLMGRVNTLTGAAPTPGQDYTALEKVYGGGAIAYTGVDGDVKLLTSSSPSPLVKEFITDLLMRDVCAGWGVPAEFFWNVSGLGGANTRFILSQADLFFQILADKIIYRYCRPVFFRWLQYRLDKGLLRECNDPQWAQKISWQTPARITVDNGRDGKLELQFLSNGATTLQEMYGNRGQGYRGPMRQWFHEFAEAKKIAMSEGVPEALLLWRAAPPGSGSAGGQAAGAYEQETEADTGQAATAPTGSTGGGGNA